MSLRERAFAAVYDRLLAPSEEAFLGARRDDLVGEAEGTVLEIGGGTGLNLPHYRKAKRVVLAEPSAQMRAKVAAHLPECAVPVTVVAAGAEQLPYPDDFFDAVVSTLVLCTVGSLNRSLAEIRRVLKPGGEFRFLEHVRASGSAADWQDRVQPVWTWLGVGCYPNRDIESAIGAAGFSIESIERFDAPGPPTPVRPQIQGVAVAG